MRMDCVVYIRGLSTLLYGVDVTITGIPKLAYTSTTRILTWDADLQIGRIFEGPLHRFVTRDLPALNFVYIVSILAER